VDHQVLELGCLVDAEPPPTVLHQVVIPRLTEITLIRRLLLRSVSLKIIINKIKIKIKIKIKKIKNEEKSERE